MIRKATCILLILSLSSSCVSKKKTTYSKERKVSVAASNTSNDNPTDANGNDTQSETTQTVDEIINAALTFSGVPYKFGGTTKRGMDCSGLLYVAFAANDVALPRVSYNMANEGKQIRIRDVEKGDLLFFKTTKSRKRINHVGLVVAIEDDEIKFIHSSSSRGVIISSLREGYWNAAFVKATRVL